MEKEPEHFTPRPWLAELRTRHGLTQEGLGERIDVSKNTVSRWESGRRDISRDSAISLAELFGGSFEEYMTERGPLSVLKGKRLDEARRAISQVPPLASLQDSPDEGISPDGFEFQGQTYVGVRVFDIGVSAGPGALNDDHQEPLYYDFYPLSFLQGFTRANVSNLAIVRVVGDSMEPTLRNGDVIMVDMSQTSPTNHGIFVLAIDQETLVKRLQYEMSTKLVSVISDNERYKDEVMPAESLHIIGRVVWAGGVKG